MNKNYEWKYNLSNNTKRGHDVNKIRVLTQKSLILLTLGYLLSGSLSAGDIAVTTTVEISSTQIQSIAGQWKFKAGDELFWGAAEYDDSKWNDTTVPQRWLEQGYPETEQFA